jgi:predicted nuclease of predicted toxin-antitoxin system
VKLLLDQNLSPRLCLSLEDLWADIVHVRDVGLSAAGDRDVWEFAVTHDFMIVTKDSDFNSLSLLSGTLTKVVWVRLGNCSTSDIEMLLRQRHGSMLEFMADAQSTLLVLSPD